MNKQQFDTYRFSVKTQMYINDTWFYVTEVNFGEGKIGVENGYYLSYYEYQDVREFNGISDKDQEMINEGKMRSDIDTRRGI